MMPRPRAALAAIVILCVLAISLTASARRRASLEETDKLPAIQNRKYRLEHELIAGVGTMPADPYTKGYTVNGGYAWHLTDLWAIEGDFHWVFNAASSLREKLQGNFGIPPSRFDKIKLSGQLGAVFKPLYGKLAFLNNQQVYGEVFVSLYGVVAQMEGGGGDAPDQQPRGERLAFGGAPGFGIRGFLSRYFSLRFDLNWMVLLAETGEVHAPLLLTLNLAFTTRSDL